MQALNLLRFGFRCVDTGNINLSICDGAVNQNLDVLIWICQIYYALQPSRHQIPYGDIIVHVTDRVGIDPESPIPEFNA